MAVNYTNKFQKGVDQAFALGSLTKVAFGHKFDFIGAKTVNVYNLVTQALGDYTRTGANRYGTPTELQDTVAEYTVTKDRSFSTTIDKGNYIEQNLVKTTANFMKAQMDEQVTPELDAYALTVLLASATSASQIPTPAALTKSNIYESFLTLNEYLDNAKVPATGRVAFIKPSAYNKLKLDPSFVKTGDMATKIAINGMVGEVDGVKIIKVPSSYFPANTDMILTHPSANVFPMRINEVKVDEEPQGISGTLIEGRFLYDAFTLANKIKACAAWKTA